MVKRLNLLTQNSKMKKTGDYFGVGLYNFTIPAHKDPETGRTTCPFAGACKSFCYANWKTRYGYSFDASKSASARKYQLTKTDDFVDEMVSSIRRKRKLDVVRIHDAGDFYSPEYRDKWFEVMRVCRDKRFYAYTKSLPFFREGKMGVPPAEHPDNFSVTFSLGGTLDDTIDFDTERHSRIFDTLEEMDEAGYVDCHEHDLYTTTFYEPDNHRTGLLNH